MKSFLVGKKISCILSLFENHEYITDFKKKVELFNSFLANWGSLINNNSQLPPTLFYKTNKRLSSKITDNDIFKIIAKLVSNKVQGHDKISIRMIKICSTSTCKPLRRIFNRCMANDIYPCEWKKANIVAIHKKCEKQTLKNIVQSLYFQFAELLLYNKMWFLS